MEKLIIGRIKFVGIYPGEVKISEKKLVRDYTTIYRNFFDIEI